MSQRVESGLKAPDVLPLAASGLWLSKAALPVDSNRRIAVGRSPSAATERRLAGGRATAIGRTLGACGNRCSRGELAVSNKLTTGNYRFRALSSRSDFLGSRANLRESRRRTDEWLAWGLSLSRCSSLLQEPICKGLVVERVPDGPMTPHCVHFVDSESIPMNTARLQSGIL